jgi:hypothetical protein
MHSPTVEPEPFDPAAFPGLEERRRADGGAASARWRELVDANTTIVADGAMGTMLFANGLLFGDPPEVWNLSKPEVVRRIHRGYLEAGSQILMTNTFGGNRLRLSLHGLEHRVAELNQTAAVLLRAEVGAADGRALVAELETGREQHRAHRPVRQDRVALGQDLPPAGAGHAAIDRPPDVDAGERGGIERTEVHRFRGPGRSSWSQCHARIIDRPSSLPVRDDLPVEPFGGVLPWADEVRAATAGDHLGRDRVGQE